MKFAHVRTANISHLRSKYFTAKRFHLPEWANFVMGVLKNCVFEYAHSAPALFLVLDLCGLKVCGVIVIGSSVDYRIENLTCSSTGGYLEVSARSGEISSAGSYYRLKLTVCLKCGLCGDIIPEYAASAVYRYCVSTHTEADSKIVAEAHIVVVSFTVIEEAYCISCRAVVHNVNVSKGIGCSGKLNARLNVAYTNVSKGVACALNKHTNRARNLCTGDVYVLNVGVSRTRRALAEGNTANGILYRNGAYLCLLQPK